MKIARPEASSDLERARALSRALAPSDADGRTAPSREPPLPEPPLPAPRFASLARKGLRAQSPTLPTLPPLAAGARWPAAIEWVCEATGAQSAFALDRTGLVVAAHGLDDEGAMRMGGRVALALEQCARVGETSVIAVAWEGITLTAFEVRVADVPLLVGVLGDGPPLPRALVCELAKVLRGAASGP